jgi:hypothetical protein
MGNVISLAPNVTNDTTFRTIVAAISGQLDLFLPKTADTGHVNTGTVTKPSANAAAGYEIRTFDDGLTPAYLKIEYGLTSSSCFGLWLTIGTGTNGAGTLTGVVSTRFASGFSVSTSTPSSWCFSGGSSGKKSWFAMTSVYETPALTPEIRFFFERIRNPNTGAFAGEETALGFSTSFNAWQAVISSAVGASPANSSVTGQWSVMTPPTATMITDGSLGLLPITPFRRGPRPPITSFAGYLPADLAPGVVTSTTTLFGGQSASYRTCESQREINQGATPTVYPAMRWTD